jgi:hypothetical protein
MNKFAINCLDFKPNITYVTIGSAYSKDGGFQQHPPFLEWLMKMNDMSIQVIIIDPLVENPPEIAKTFSLEQLDNNWYGGYGIDVIIIKENFEFDRVTLETPTNFSNSKSLLDALIKRTLDAKLKSPQNTYLLFVHDFSGNDIGKLSDSMTNAYEKSSYASVYQQNVLIDINFRMGPSCYPNLNDKFFRPIIFKTSENSLEILNLFSLDDNELVSMLFNKCDNLCVKELIVHIVITRLTAFMNNEISIYRQIRLYLEGVNKSMFIDSFGTGILTGISDMQIILSLMNKQASINIINELTSRLLIRLDSRCKMFETLGVYEKLFGSFLNYLKNPISNFYELSNIFRSCLENTREFLLTFDTNKYSTWINDYVSDYMFKNKRIPLFMEFTSQENAIQEMDQIYPLKFIDERSSINESITDNKNTVNDQNDIVDL